MMFNQMIACGIVIVMLAIVGLQFSRAVAQIIDKDNAEVWILNLSGLWFDDEATCEAFKQGLEAYRLPYRESFCAKVSLSNQDG